MYLQPHMAKRRLKEMENKISADFAKIQGYDPYKLMEFLKNLAESLLKGFIVGNYLKMAVKETKGFEPTYKELKLRIPPDNVLREDLF